MWIITNFFSDQFIDVIRWDDPESELLIKKWSQNLDEIKNNSSLVVDPGLSAIFVHNGKIEAIQTESGKWTLDTTNIPFLSSLKNFMSGMETHDKAQVYFIKTNEITNQKWGTPNFVTYIDPIYNFPVELRAFGNFTFRITDIENFWVNYVSNKESVSTDSIRMVIVDRLVGTIASILAKKSIGYTEIAKYGPEIAKDLMEATKEEFAKFGLTLTDFRIENTNFTEKTQEFIDKVTSKNADVASINTTANINQSAMNNYSSIEKLNIAWKAAENGGAMGDMMSAWMGMAMGASMAGSLSTQINQGVTNGTESTTSKLEMIKELLDKWLISNEDYEKKKTEVLSLI